MSSNYIDGLMRECQQQQAEVERLKALQPCGHPNADIVSSDEGTQYCGRCAEIDRAVKQERDRCLDVMEGVLIGLDND